MNVIASHMPWFADIANYLASGVIRDDLSFQDRKRLRAKCRYYFWEDPYLFHVGSDEVIRRCIPEDEQKSILSSCHDLDAGGHFGGKKTTFKVLQS
ncbi:hypothetical protein M9Y07_19220, partial [Clostridioides difficile]|nr:hypothetical protein [Clostridioides difficile]